MLTPSSVDFVSEVSVSRETQPVSFDVIVVGGATRVAKLQLHGCPHGARTALVTKNFSDIGVMSRNPAIGGLGKGQIVAGSMPWTGSPGRTPIGGPSSSARTGHEDQPPAGHGRRSIEARISARWQDELFGYPNLTILAGMVSQQYVETMGW